jgi:4-amino-4-deoxy-L-arabinose transferase-like glycosyltransferase
MTRYSEDTLSASSSEKSAHSSQTAEKRSAWTFARLMPLLLTVATLALFALGIGVRMYDLTDQPLDFHPTRQLRSAIIARGMYYDMKPNVDLETKQQAVNYWFSMGQYEPSILERLVAYTYLAIGKETLWVSRIYTSAFWIIGGLALFALARRMTAGRSSGASMAIALVAVAYYLLLPFGVQASRSFQPDPGMVMWIVLFLYAIYRWSEERAWKWAILAGLLGGLAVLTKAVAAYVVGATAIALVLHTLGIRRAWRSPQPWAMAALMVVPSGIYYIAGNESRAAEFFSSWTLSLSHLLLEPATYARWLNLVQSLMGLAVLMLGLVGVLIARGRNKALLVGAWVGYGIYGLFLPYQMYTHNYYHLQVVPLLALSLVPVISAIQERFEKQAWIWKALFVGVAVMGIAYTSWVSIAEQAGENNRNEPAYWQEIASYLPTDGKILALTQDYGYRLMYYGWRKVIIWPIVGERQLSKLRGNDQELKTFFDKKSEGTDYFLVTAFGQWNKQPDLQNYLNKNFPLYAQGDGYLIYDLTQPLSAAVPANP